MVLVMGSLLRHRQNQWLVLSSLEIAVVYIWAGWHAKTEVVWKGHSYHEIENGQRA